MTIFDLITSQELTAYWEQLPDGDDISSAGVIPER